MTKIADVIVPEVFNAYVVERTTEIAKFLMGGIVSNNDELNALASAGGKLINMPFWEDLTGDDEVLSDTSALTPSKISASQDVAALLMRGKAWTVNDLAKALSGSDPMAAIGDLVAAYWARRYQAVGLAALKGVFANNVAGANDMTADVSGATNDAVSAATRFSAESFIDGQATFGDVIGAVSGIGMHPDVYYRLKKEDSTSFEKDSQGDLEIEFYRELPLIVDRSLPFTPAAGNGAGDAAAKYTTYLFGQGALGMGQGAAPVPTETDRDSLAGEDVLINRTHFIMHPRGVAFQNASVSGTSPTNAELANGANWDRVYERGNVRLAQIITNG